MNDSGGFIARLANSLRRFLDKRRGQRYEEESRGGDDYSTLSDQDIKENTDQNIRSNTDQNNTVGSSIGDSTWGSTFDTTRVAQFDLEKGSGEYATSSDQNIRSDTYQNSKVGSSIDDSTWGSTFDTTRVAQFDIEKGSGEYTTPSDQNISGDTDQNNTAVRENSELENRSSNAEKANPVVQQKYRRPLPQPSSKSIQANDGVDQNNKEILNKYGEEKRSSVGEKADSGSKPAPKQPISKQQQEKIQSALDDALKDIRGQRERLKNQKQTGDVKITNSNVKTDLISEKPLRRPLPQPKNIRGPSEPNRHMRINGDAKGSAQDESTSNKKRLNVKRKGAALRSSGDAADIDGLLKEYENILNDKGSGDERFDGGKNLNWGRDFNKAHHAEFEQEQFNKPLSSRQKQDLQSVMDKNVKNSKMSEFKGVAETSQRVSVKPSAIEQKALIKNYKSVENDTFAKGKHEDWGANFNKEFNREFNQNELNRGFVQNTLDKKVLPGIKKGAGGAIDDGKKWRDVVSSGDKSSNRSFNR